VIPWRKKSVCGLLCSAGSEMGNLNLYAIAGVAFNSLFYYTFFSKLRCNRLGVLCVICGGFVQREVGLETEERGGGWGSSP